MRRNRPLAFLILFPALLVPGSALAQEEPPKLELFVQGGVSLFNSSSLARAFTVSVPGLSPVEIESEETTTFSTTGRLFTGFRYRWTAQNALEASLSYSPTRIQHESNVTVTPPVNGFSGARSFYSESLTLLNPALNYVRYLPARGRLEPFVTGGVGFTSFLGEEYGQNTFAANIGGGADFHLNRRVALRSELRDFITRPPAFTGFRGAAHNLVPSSGLVFKLW